MPKPVERVRLAMTAVAEATPGERRRRLVALYEAAVDLRDLVARYQDWLVAEWAWLEHEASRDDEEYAARDARYLRRMLVYQDAHDLLAAAYAMVRDDTSGRVGTRRVGVQRPLAEAPF